MTRKNLLLAALAFSLASIATPAGAQVGGNLNGGSSGGATPAGNVGDLQTKAGSKSFAASHLNDDGTLISSTEPVSVKTNAIYWEIPNSGTGTTLNKLAIYTGAPSTVKTAAITDTTGIIGIVTGGAGTTGSARIAVAGQASCVFDGATTAGHFVIASTSVAGDCSDGGATDPNGVAVIGNVLTTNGSGGTYQVALYPPNIATLGTQGNTGGGGGGSTGGLTAHGSPASGSLTSWFSAKSLQSGDLSGDCTTSGALVVTCTNINHTFTKAQRSTPVALSISTSTFTPNFDTGQNFEITLVHASCPCTLANPSTSLVPGQTGTIKVIQSATGGDGVTTWGSSYYFPGGTSQIAFSAGANNYDILSYAVDIAGHINLTPPALNFSH